MELVVVLAIALIVLGPKRLPDAGKSLGHGIREFKGAVTGARTTSARTPLAPDERRLLSCPGVALRPQARTATARR
ncbi:MAG: Sec-independent protein translocase subunit TatA/TatB [Solirubrobacteraceae bacterium]